MPPASGRRRGTLGFQRPSLPPLSLLATLVGAALVLLTLWEVFETMILPRTILRPGRMTHVFYLSTHWFERKVVRRAPWNALKQTVLGTYGPLSVLLLIAFWATLIIVGFAAVHYGLHTRFSEKHERVNFGNLLYFSGSTFFTLGYGDLTPSGATARFLSVAEAGLGFGMLAAVMGYLPVLYGGFSAREAAVMRLANRCGSKIDGVALVARYARTGNHDGLATALEELEGWLSDLMETTVSYPMLALYRSPRDDRSWVGAVVAVLDATVVLQLPAETPWPPRLVDQAELTYSMAHRTLRAVTHALRQESDPEVSREVDLDALAARLERSGVRLAEGWPQRWTELVRRYDADACCLAEFLCLDIPDWPERS